MHYLMIVNPQKKSRRDSPRLVLFLFDSHAANVAFDQNESYSLTRRSGLEKHVQIL